MQQQSPRSTLFPYTTLFRSYLLSSDGETLTPTAPVGNHPQDADVDRKSTRLNSSHTVISYAVFCLKKKIPPLVRRRQLVRLRVARRQFQIRSGCILLGMCTT